MISWGMLMFQDRVSPLMEQLLFFHDHTLMVLLIITSLIIYVNFIIIMRSMEDRYIMEGHWVEIVWTLFPAVVLVFIAFPSLRLLYLLDEVIVPGLTLKVIGHQWFWRYEYGDFGKVEFDSYIIVEGGLGSFRLLDVDNRLVVPEGTMIRCLVGSEDVIHSWAVPGLGVKIDAVPGRLNQVSFFMRRVGL